MAVGALSDEEAYNAFLIALDTNGYSIVERGDFTRVPASVP